jgi:hypothetical protein
MGFTGYFENDRNYDRVKAKFAAKQSISSLKISEIELQIILAHCLAF